MTTTELRTELETDARCALTAALVKAANGMALTLDEAGEDNVQICKRHMESALRAVLMEMAGGEVVANVVTDALSAE